MTAAAAGVAFGIRAGKPVLVLGALAGGRVAFIAIAAAGGRNGHTKAADIIRPVDLLPPALRTTAATHFVLRCRAVETCPAAEVRVVAPAPDDLVAELTKTLMHLRDHRAMGRFVTSGVFGRNGSRPLGLDEDDPRWPRWPRSRS